MLSVKIKGKSVLKARTFLHGVHDKIHVCYWSWLSAENSADYEADFATRHSYIIAFIYDSHMSLI